MNMQPIGMVPLARAAALLSGSGQPVHPSNLSRYLDRFPSIPNEKQGKRRMVNFEALVQHRSTNIAVIEKTGAATSPAQAEASPLPLMKASEPRPDPTEEVAAPQGSPLQKLSEDIKRIQLRQAQLDLDEREKRLLPVEEVFSLISTTVGELVNALQRQDGEIAQTYGREVAGDMRRRRKAAQAAASASLAKRAREILEAADATRAVDAANPEQEEGTN